MSKELTEKWKNNKLEKGGYYYILCYNGWKGSSFEMISLACDGTIALPVKEVLAPVPSYEELREKEVIYNTTSRCNETLLWENESLKNKVEKLKEQLQEANNIIKQYCFYEYGKPYLKKWGLK